MGFAPYKLLAVLASSAVGFGGGVICDRLTQTSEAGDAPFRKGFKAQTKFYSHSLPPRDYFGPPKAPEELGIEKAHHGAWRDRFTGLETLLIAVRALKLEDKWGCSQLQAAARLDRMVEAVEDSASALVTLSAWSFSKDEAVALANGVRDASGERHRNIEDERLRRLKERVAKQVKEQETIAENAHVEMLSVMKRNGIILLPPEEPTLTPAREQDRMRETQLEREIVKLSLLREGLSAFPLDRPVFVFPGMGGSDALSSAHAAYQSDVATLGVLLNTGYGSMHPRVASLKSSLAGQKQHMEEILEEFQKSIDLQREQSQQMLIEAKKRTRDFESPAIRAMERKMREEYSIAKYRYESQLQLAEAMKKSLSGMASSAPMSWIPLQVVEPAAEAGRVWR